MNSPPDYCQWNSKKVEQIGPEGRMLAAISAVGRVEVPVCHNPRIGILLGPRPELFGHLGVVGEDAEIKLNLKMIN